MMVEGVRFDVHALRMKTSPDGEKKKIGLES